MLPQSQWTAVSDNRCCTVKLLPSTVIYYPLPVVINERLDSKPQIAGLDRVSLTLNLLEVDCPLGTHGSGFQILDPTHGYTNGPFKNGSNKYILIGVARPFRESGEAEERSDRENAGCKQTYFT